MKIAAAIANQVNGKTEIYSHQLVAAQNIDRAELYHKFGNTLLPVVELVKFACAKLIDN